MSSYCGKIGKEREKSHMGLAKKELNKMKRKVEFMGREIMCASRQSLESHAYGFDAP